MRFSEAWLREHVNPPVTTERLVEQLTMAGLEVDSVSPAAPPFFGVVVAEVVEVLPHPNADKLKVCRVRVGAEEVQVVCGAANVRAGLKAPLARIGAELPNGLKIQRSKLRGVESLGMLCSAKELGIFEAAEGLWELPQEAPVGEDLRAWLKLDDAVIEVDLTPNRADCLSVEGIAREVALLNRIAWQKVAVEPVAPACDASLPICVAKDAYTACPRYLGRRIVGINANAPTPLWMQERLRRSGIRSLGAVVDVTNYVLLELGQPLHAFDAERIRGEIRVRFARPGESLRLLNGQEIELAADCLVIADAERPLALAGIMGGQDSAVGDATTDVFLECAFFAPEAIAGRARRYGLSTDAAYRFERGVDPALPSRALERATQLLVAIAGGEPGPIVKVSSQEDLPKRLPIRLRQERVASLLGANLEAAEIEDILSRLGMQLESVAVGEWQVVPPSFRFDIAIEADLIEELARVYGYERLPSRTPALPDRMLPSPEGRLALTRVQDALVDRGYYEAITYSFVDPALQAKLTPHLEPVALLNPLSQEMGVMRTTLWTGLLQAARYNLNRQQTRVRLFEVGLSFWREGGQIRQEPRLAGLATGLAFPEQWAERRKMDFYDLKADVEALLRLTGREQDFRFAAAEHPALHPGQTAALIERHSLTCQGWLGMLHPALAQELGLEQDVFLFELSQAVVEEKRIPAFRPLSKYPAVRRDLAVIVREEVKAQEVLDAVANALPGLWTEVGLFDVWQGQGLAEGEKSLGLRIVFQRSDRTLTDAEVDEMVARILDRLADRFQARLRGES
nr:phenylalanyl-tRNA synthetase beta chain [uncultured Gammaproteobacteria bacterium]BAL54517.1 phenylalanyl-tRNA synthetase beta chain [uncultured Gammaproteobacteria bacterium]